MKHGSREFLNAIGIAALATLLVFAFVSASEAAEPVWDDLDNTQKSAVTCAGVNLIVAAHMEDEVASQIINTVAEYWINASTGLLDVDKKYIEYAFTVFNDGFANGNFTWEQLVDGAEECGQLMLEIEADNT